MAALPYCRFGLAAGHPSLDFHGRQTLMPRRNSPRSIRALEDLNQLAQLVVDKRLGQRSSAKKGRRNRHYEKQFIRNALAHRAVSSADTVSEDCAVRDQIQT